MSRNNFPNILAYTFASIVSVALTLGTLGSPLQAAPTAPTIAPSPQVRLEITFALVTDPDLKISRVTPRTIPIDQLIISPRPWGEARLEHLDLQVISGSDTKRLLAALAKDQRLDKATSDIIPSDGQDKVVHFQQVGTVGLNQKTDSFQEASRPTQPSFPQPTIQPLRFFLRPQVNADGTVSLSFAPSHLTARPSITPLTMSAASALSAEELDEKGTVFVDIGTLHSGETIALTGLLEGPHRGGVEVVAFVTPIIL